MSQNPSLADVRARRAEIKKIVGPLLAEDKELEAAETVLLRFVGPGAVVSMTAIDGTRTPLLVPAPAAPPSPPQAAEEEEEAGSVIDTVKEMMKGDETIEELIIMLLRECDDPWWTATEVQSHLTSVKGKEVPMSSVSPTLTNMKTKGALVRQGLRVALASRASDLGLKNEAAAE
jgi:hypothetical protein